MYPLLSSCETVDQVDQRLQIACLKFVRFCVMVSRANARVTHIYGSYHVIVLKTRQQVEVEQHQATARQRQQQYIYGTSTHRLNIEPHVFFSFTHRLRMRESHQHRHGDPGQGRTKCHHQYSPIEPQSRQRPSQ